VLDPFGGVHSGLDAMRIGCHWTGCELEEKFVVLASRTSPVDLRFLAAGWGTARILQGDSRRLRRDRGGAAAIISSPPYAESPVASGGDNIDRSRIGTGMNLVGAKVPATPPPSPTSGICPRETSPVRWESAV